MLKQCHKIFIASLLIGIWLLSSSTICAQTYGLKFKGHEETLDKRTELNLSPNDFLKLNDEFEISFDYKIDLINPNAIFGYVVRVINQENYNVDLISTPSPDIRLNLVIGKGNLIIPVIYPPNSINNWINLRIKFIMSEDRMIFYTPDTFYVQEGIGFKKHDAFKIIFGANDFHRFKTTDVPSINIKNVKIIENGSLKYYWPLDLKEGNIAKDKIKKHEASVKNPIWLMYNHQTWQKKVETEVTGSLLVAADEENNRIFMVGAKELIIYSGLDNSIQKIPYQNKPNFFSENYRTVYNTKDKKIYCYLTEGEKYFTLNIENGIWSDTITPANATQSSYRHHNQFYYSKNNSLYLFGGYGFHKYNNIIRKVDLTQLKSYALQTNDSIFWPRYLAGLGALNDTLYILGGYGSESGNQLINPRSYHDLIGYSIKDSNFFKKFEIPPIIDDMVVANSMWIDQNTRKYYALIFEKSKFDGYLQLIEGSLDSPVIELLGGKIPFTFIDIRSYAGLFYLPTQKKLLAFTSYLSDNGQTKAEIYSISYPLNKFVKEPEVSQKTAFNKYFYILFAFILLAAVITLIYLYRRKKANDKAKVQIQNEIAITEIKPKEIIINEPVYQVIYFGGFQVFNKNMEDITSKFSPLLKELYLLIVLHTSKNDKGISSEKLTEILWYSKSEKSARNNRAVNIARLRSIMTEIGNCDLTKKTGYWKIISEDNSINSDYLDFIEITSSKANITKEKILQLINITKKGAFLYNVHYEWLDEFKASVSEKIIDTLIEFAYKCEIKKEAEFIIQLADSVFNFDMINEDAMILKCRAESFRGKHSLAKTTYEKFIKEYFTMYGQEYNQSFIKILEKKE